MAAATGFGVNFGHDDASYKDNAACIRQLGILKSMGITRIRVNLISYLAQNFNAPFRDQMRLVCTTALSMGFYVIWGYNGDTGLNSGNIAAFKQACRDGAAWAKSVGLSEWQCGNEEDLRTGYSQANLLTQLKDVCQAIKVTDMFSGVVSTAITTNVYSIWQADRSNWNTFMKLDLHIYGILGAAHFDTYVKQAPAELGTDVYCGEWGSSDNGRNDFSTDAAWTKEVLRRQALFIQNGWTSHYYFAYAIQYDATEQTKWSLYRTTLDVDTELLRRFGRVRQTVIDR